VAVAAQPEAKGHDLSLPPGKKVYDDRRWSGSPGTTPPCSL